MKGNLGLVLVVLLFGFLLGIVAMLTVGPWIAENVLENLGQNHLRGVYHGGSITIKLYIDPYVKGEYQKVIKGTTRIFTDELGRAQTAAESFENVKYLELLRWRVLGDKRRELKLIGILSYRPSGDEH